MTECITWSCGGK